MVLLQNDLITIQLHPELEVLEVIYGDLYLLPVELIKAGIDETIQLITINGINRLLYNSSGTVTEINKAESIEIAAYFFRSLNQTEVKKVARLGSPKYIVGTAVKQSVMELAALEKPGYLFETFTNREEALDWLAGWNNRLLT